VADGGQRFAAPRPQTPGNNFVSGGNNSVSGGSVTTQYAVPDRVPPGAGSGRAKPYVRPAPIHDHLHYYPYPQYYYPYGYGAFGLGYFYYDPYAWYGYGYGVPYSSYAVYTNPYPVAYQYGEIRLQVRPRNAEVYVDGYYAGRVEDFDGFTQSLRLEEGNHTIEIVADGYDTLVFNVRVTAGRKIDYRAELTLSR
jgi:hypothetical protein